jgi:hypothetical protein
MHHQDLRFERRAERTRAMHHQDLRFERRAERTRATDPFWARLAAMAGLFVIAAPIAAAIGHDGRDAIHVSGLPGAVAVAELAAPSSGSPADPAASSTVAAPSSVTTQGAPVTTAAPPAPVPTTAPVATAPAGTTAPTTAAPATTPPNTTAPAVTAPATTLAKSLPQEPAPPVALDEVPDTVVDPEPVPAVAEVHEAAELSPPQEAVRAPVPPTTVPPTTVPPTTQPAPPSTLPPADGEYTAEENEAIIRHVWPDELEDHAVEIAWRESNLRNDVRNYCCYGLFQIYYSVHRSWLAGLGITSAEDLYDPVLNSLAAYTLYQRAGGWGPWGG